eukprot:Clim_evm15s195 gene=Clim_evmTU15s195
MEVKISWKGSVRSVTVSCECTYGEFKKILVEQFSLAVETVKLAFPGSVKVHDEERISDIKVIANGGLIRLFATEQSTLQDTLQKEAKLKAAQHIYDRTHASATIYSAVRDRDLEWGKTYGFKTMEVLHKFRSPPPYAAMALLERLNSDPGIRAVMKKRKWLVGKLHEMEPEGKVGVSEVCILGYNKGKGMEIALRLRTDDLSGFRYYETIKKVLIHELTHMVYNDHDDDFKKLNSELTKEADQLDWTKSTGHVLGSNATSTNSDVFNPRPLGTAVGGGIDDPLDTTDDLPNVVEQTSRNNLLLADPKGTGKGLSSARKAAAAAAERRMKQRQQQLKDQQPKKRS